MFLSSDPSQKCFCVQISWRRSWRSSRRSKRQIYVGSPWLPWRWVHLEMLLDHWCQTQGMGTVTSVTVRPTGQWMSTASSSTLYTKTTVGLWEEEGGKLVFKFFPVSVLYAVTISNWTPGQEWDWTEATSGQLMVINLFKSNQSLLFISIQSIKKKIFFWHVGCRVHLK